LPEKVAIQEQEINDKGGKDAALRQYCHETFVNRDKSQYNEFLHDR
jgi:hypothetical protein